MALYLLSEWEHNGYHDSDFYAAVWDSETQTVRSIETGSTRYAGGGYATSEFLACTSEIARKAVAWLTSVILGKLKEQAHRRVNEPDEVKIGQRVRLLVKHKNMVKETVVEPCHKCNGTGKWVNPSRDSDVRTCFGCNGTGERKRNGAKVKDTNGKQVWLRFEPGTSGKVTWVGTFRTIYANGYNKADRHTLSVVFETDDGQIMKAPLKKLALDMPMPSKQELREKAQRLARSCKFGAVLHSRYAWDSKNFAKQFV